MPRNVLFLGREAQRFASSRREHLQPDERALGRGVPGQPTRAVARLGRKIEPRWGVNPAHTEEGTMAKNEGGAHKKALDAAVREAERRLAVKPDDERATRVAAQRREAAADKSLRPGSPEWQRVVNRRSQS
jgi:hypothetical protein